MEISASIPDLSREAPRRLWDPPRRILKSLRRYQASRERRGLLATGVRYMSVLEHRFWSAVTGADIPLNCRLGGGLLLIHANGIVIHPDATVGPNCLILQQVTLTAGVKLGGHVDVGAGAKIIRPVSVGDHANVGANAVVLSDIPEGATAVGIPARIILPHNVEPSAASARATDWKATDGQERGYGRPSPYYAAGNDRAAE
jgi:serine O-acetyltransferase